MCSEQCLLPFPVRQHVAQELALSASAAGPQTYLCYPWGDFCLHCHAGVWLGSKTGDVQVLWDRTKAQGRALLTDCLHWDVHQWGQGPITAGTPEQCVWAPWQGADATERLQVPGWYFCATLASGLHVTISSHVLFDVGLPFLPALRKTSWNVFTATQRTYTS